jgi:hypothetical protein
MADKNYDGPRKKIGAEIRRKIEVESGHKCAIKDCFEHTWLEIHHVDENRDNNNPENLILLCDKHHKMSHANIIDRKSLRMYKDLLTVSINKIILEQFDQLKTLIRDSNYDSQPKSILSEKQPIDDSIQKYAPKRFEILDFALRHVAISHYEKVNSIYFEHQVEFVRGEDHLLLHAIRQDDDLPEDIIIEFSYLRKSYLDAPAYAQLLEKKLELYELLTGRKAKGILLVVVGRSRMKEEGYLNLTRKSVQDSKNNILLVIYDCEDVGFYPGPVSAGVFAINLKKDNETSKSNLGQ